MKLYEKVSSDGGLQHLCELGHCTSDELKCLLAVPQNARHRAVLLISFEKIWFIKKDMDPWIYGSAAGAPARAAAGAAASVAAAVCICYMTSCLCP